MAEGGRRQLMVLAAAGTQLSATIGAATLLGWWLDGKFATGPWLTLGFLLVGVAGGFTAFLRTVRAQADGKDDGET